MIFFDTETCGLHGPIVLIQYADGVDGEIKMYCPWESPVYMTMELIEWMVAGEVCAFNLAFDWFHLAQMYTTLSLIEDKYEFLSIDEYAAKEKEARHVDLCLKPEGACDLMMHARKGKFQTLMARRPMTIRKVPMIMAGDLIDILTERIDIPDIYFANNSDYKKRWGIKNISTCGQLCDLELKFNPSGRLKAIAQHILGERTIVWNDITLSNKLMPAESAIAPFGGNWPNLIRFHIKHWTTDVKARQYAANDVDYLKKLWKYFGSPESNDVDSVLTTMVSSVRWCGLALDPDKLFELEHKFRDQAVSVDGINVDSPQQVKEYLRQFMTKEEIDAVSVNGKFSTSKIVLTHLAEKTIKTRCECGGLNPECVCQGSGLVCTGKPHPVGEKAQAILDLRFVLDRIELIKKLRGAGRFHVDLSVIGTRSSRMSGWGLTISHDKDIRNCFPLADEGEILSGGDFDAFEISIMDAAYKDPKLHEYLMAGHKIHGIFGAYLFDTTYDEIMASQGRDGMANLYARAKNGVFALCYGGEADTLVNRVAISPEQADAAYKRWCDDFPGWAAERQKIFDRFCSMRQLTPGGQVTWYDPDNSVESMFGFERRFDLENSIAQTMYELSNDPPKNLFRFKGRVTRQAHKGEQSLIGALRSSLYACAFAAQAANMRAAANHVIQATGAEIIKGLQIRLWDLQPKGIHPWKLKALNIHDELMTVHKPGIQSDISNAVAGYVEGMRETIPLIGMEWKTNVASWGEK